MAITARQIAEAAVLKSRRNTLGGTANTELELLPHIRRAVHGLFSVTARINRYFYGDSVVMPYVAGQNGWSRPTLAELIFLIHNSGGEDVIPVPIEEPDADIARPCVTRLGRVFRPIEGHAPGPDEYEDLTFYFSRKPIQPTTLDGNIDTAFPDEYDELLNLETAIYLALKDGGSRLEEVPILRGDRDRWLQLYLAHVEHETIGEVRTKSGSAYRFHATSVIPVGSLLAGGTTLELAA